MPVSSCNIWHSHNTVFTSISFWLWSQDSECICTWCLLSLWQTSVVISFGKLTIRGPYKIIRIMPICLSLQLVRIDWDFKWMHWTVVHLWTDCSIFFAYTARWLCYSIDVIRNSNNLHNIQYYVLNSDCFYHTVFYCN